MHVSCLTSIICERESHITLGRIVHSTRTFTSSTAQGCGGSFKNRKPIGRVGCCDSRMAERNPLMDRKVVGVGVVLFGVAAMVAAVTSLTTPGCSVV